MDFNAIYQAIVPYLGTGAIATTIVTILALAFKVLKITKEAKSIFSSTHAESIAAFKKAIPESLYVSLESITKSELSKIITKIEEAVENKFLSQIKANTELTQAIASALVSLKAIPDSSKVKIAELLDIPEVETTESLKIDLLPVEETEKVKTPSKDIRID